MVPFILTVGARSSCMVNFTSLYPRGKSALPAGKETGWPPEPVWMVLEKTEMWTAIAPRGVVIYYRRSGTTHRSRFKNGFFTLKTEPIGLPETSVVIYHCWLRNSLEELCSHLHRGRSFKSHKTEMHCFCCNTSPCSSSP